MGWLSKLLLIIFAVSTTLIGVKINDLLQPLPPPDLEETWWGPEKTGVDNKSIKPFKINVPDLILNDLNDRLKKARPFVPPLQNAKQNYGINTKLLEQIVDFWRTKYNWREREMFLNKYSQFKTQIQGLDIHFLHVIPQNPNNLKVLPLLMLHGWPGSFREFYDVIPLLTTPQKNRNFVFELIIPSLPGYGFSQAAAKPGLGALQMAVVFKNLMERLGFKNYYLQGGDWGAQIISNMASLYPSRVLGLHSNMCFSNTFLSNVKRILGSFWPSLVVAKEHESKMYPLSKFYYNLLLEFGYMHIQATKPDTVGVGLNDSPVGMAAYILEKFITWTDFNWKNLDDGGLKLKYKYEDLLDNVMIYWVTNSMTTSMRLYAETANIDQYTYEIDRVPITVPAACARFQNELMYMSDSVLTDKYTKLIQTTDFEDGGHFAAFEVPKLLAVDIWSAIFKMELQAKK